MWHTHTLWNVIHPQKGMNPDTCYNRMNLEIAKCSMIARKKKCCIIPTILDT
jgi:hypothetical protein